METRGRLLQNVGITILCLAIITLVGYMSFKFGLKDIAMQEKIVNAPTIYAYGGLDWPSRYTVSPIYWLPLHLLPAKEYQEMETPLPLTLPYWIVVSVAISKLINRLTKR